MPIAVVLLLASVLATGASAATPIRITVDGASSITPAMAMGADGKCRLVWTDTRTGSTEIFFTMLDAWGNRLLPDIQVSNSPGASSTVPRVDVDAQGYAYICWLENKTVWLAKLDAAGQTVDATAVSLGFNYLAEYPDLDVTPSSGLGVGFSSQSGVSDEYYQVLFDPDLNKICQRYMGINLTWLDRHVTVRCDDDLHCTMYWQAVGLTSQNLRGGAITPACGDFGSGNICSGGDYSTMSNHAAGLVVQRGSRIYLGSGGGCPTPFSELPGPAVSPSARTLDPSRSVVAWQDGRNGTSDIYFAVYNNSNRVKTGVDSLLAGGASSSTSPAVTSDLLGTAIVAWQDDRDGNSEIYFARTPEPSASVGSFTGTVYDAVTQMPIPYAQVSIQGPERDPLVVRSFVAGGDGHYRAAGLPSGLHSLMASTLGYVSPRKDGVALAAGEERVVDLRVSTGVVLHGTVRDVDSQRPVRGAQLTLQANSGPPFVRATTSGLDGSYRFDVLPGSYSIAASYPVPGVSEDYFSVANDYYTGDTVPALDVPGDLRKDFSLSSNTVVLLHGIFSTGETFGQAANVAEGDSMLRARLEHEGFHTEAPTRDWRRSIPEQGVAVARWFADRPFTSARVIAHSMGGLAARWYVEEIGAPGPGRSVPLLVTLGTPHHGSPVASEAHTLLLALGALPEALGLIPFTGGLSLLAWEAAIRHEWPFLIDLQPSNANLDWLNYHDDDYSDDPSRFTCNLAGGPGHDAEQISGTTTYVALAGESPTSGGMAALGFYLGIVCANDGVVPVHSARLWNGAVSNLRTRCLANPGTGDDCGVGHRPQLQGAGASALEPGGDPVFISSGCVAVQLVNMLQGDIPTEDCPSPLGVSSVADSLYEALPEVDLVLAAQDSLASQFTITAGQSIVVWTRWHRGGVRLRLTDPTGAAVDSAACLGDPTRNFVSDPLYHWARLELASPIAGSWTVHASTDADSAQHVSVRTYVTGDVTLDATVRSSTSPPGQPIDVAGSLHRSQAPLTGATVSARWTAPDGGSGSIALHDDGLAPDAAADDGVYSGQLVGPVVGSYGLELTASGGTGPAYGERAARSAFRVGFAPDIRMDAGDIDAPQNWVYPGDPLALQVHVHNAGNAAADSVWFGVRDDSTGAMVKDTVLAVPGGGEAIVPVTFSSTRRGFHRLSLWAVAAGGLPDVDPNDHGAVFGLEVVEFGSEPVLSVPPDRGPFRTGPSLISRVVPTPSHEVARIEFLVPQDVPAAQLTVFDVSGRVSARLESGSLPAGWHAFVWDPSGTGGRRSPGVYFYRVEAGGRLGTGRIVLR